MSNIIQVGKFWSKTMTRATLHLDLDILIKTRLLVQGNSGAGKSWLLRRLAEAIFGKFPVIIIDPEGEFATLREKYGYVLVGKGGETPADPRSAALVATRLLELGASAVCDIYDLKKHERHRWVKLFLEALMEAPKSIWRKVIIIIDEAHKFAPEKGQGESEALEAMVDLATRGRKRGFCPIYATQRIGKLTKNVAAELMNIMVGQTFIDIDQHRAAEALGIPRKEERQFFAEMKVIEPGRFYCLGRAMTKDRTLVEVGPVKTSHPEPGSSKHSAAPPPPPGKIKHLLPKLSDLPQEAADKAKNEADLRKQVRELKTKLSIAERTPKQSKAAPATKTVEKIKVKEVRILSKSQEGKLKKALEKTEDLIKRVKKFGILQGVIEALLQPVTEGLKAGVQAAEKYRQGPPQSGGYARHHYRADPSRRPAPVPAPAPQPTSTSEESGDLGKGERKLLTVLGQFYPASRTRVQLGMLAGYSSSGGTFGNYFGLLKRKGLITESAGQVVINEKGLAAIGGEPEPLSTEAIIEMWRGRLGRGELKMMDVLLERYPHSIDRVDLGVASGYAYTGGTFGNYLGTLRRNELIVVSGSAVVASSTLMGDE